jgi:hypothetical protein
MFGSSNDGTHNEEMAMFDPNMMVIKTHLADIERQVTDARASGGKPNLSGNSLVGMALVSAALSAILLGLVPMLKGLSSLL